MPNNKPLSISQVLILDTAAARPNHMIMPLPATLRARGASQQRLLESLLKLAFVKELVTKNGALSWRTSEEGKLYALRLTPAGRAVLNSAGTDQQADVQGRRASNDLTQTVERADTYSSTDISGPELQRIVPAVAAPAGKLGQLLDAVGSTSGATLGELVSLTGWLPHTTRAALTRLKQRGYPVHLVKAPDRKAYCLGQPVGIKASATDRCRKSRGRLPTLTGPARASSAWLHPPSQGLAMRKPAKPTIEPRSTIRRCAIYTRKSSEEGLEQAFNSLDAQREACEAYICGQRHEGWTAVPTLYDDGGISGGTLERPALQQLLADIAARKIDLVVVYKVDRLTRSLSDFAKIVDVFDASGASFVSVTQQFNTSTSMGRLTLNMLLSFAQFEREVTGERIRDKIAASKRKGMWMGGNVPLGYDVQDRKLIINPAEATKVRHIFSLYLQLGSVRLLKEQLAAEGLTRKVRVQSASQNSRGGCGFSRGALYVTLQNRLYRGEVHHQGAFYPGEHDAIVDARLWEAVQTHLSENRVKRAAGTRSDHPSLLAGLVYDHQGERLIPTHASKGSRRYRYYVSKSLQIEPGSSSVDGVRIPASDLEQIVTDRLLQFLKEPTEVLAAVRGLLMEGSGQRLLLERTAQMAATWNEQPAAEHRIRLRALVLKVWVRTDRMELHLSPVGLAALLNPNSTPDHSQAAATETVLTTSIQLTRWKKEVRLLVLGPAGATEPNPTLVRLLARAHALWDTLLRENLTITALAQREGVTKSYVTRLVRLTCLAPDIKAAILDGQQPAAFSANNLMVDSRLPLAWSAQRQALGFI